MYSTDLNFRNMEISLKTLLVYLVFAAASGTSVLNHCEKSEDNSTVLEDIKINYRRVYVFVKGARPLDDTADTSTPIVITATDTNGLVPFRISLNCNEVEGYVKVDMKTKNGGWYRIRVFKRKEMHCLSGEMAIVINHKKNKLWIGDHIAPIKLAGTGRTKFTEPINLEVTGNVEVVRMSNGKCAAFPPGITTCTEARGWYLEHEHCFKGKVNKKGFLKCGKAPQCNDDGTFSLSQIFANSQYGCADPADGSLLENTFKKKDVDNYETYCENKYPQYA